MTRFLWLACAAALAALGCDGDRSVEIDEVRTLPGQPILRDGTDADRFGLEPATAAPSAPGGLAYDLPEGWVERPPEQFKDINLEAPGGVPVWVSVLGGQGGGALPNLNRWRGQVGLEPVDDDALAALERVPMLGGRAWWVDLPSADGHSRLTGLMLLADDRSVFVKMRGAPDSVEAQLGNLRAFAGSLREAPAGAAPSVGGPSSAAPSFTWTAPGGWTPLPEKFLREAYHTVDEDTEVWFTPMAGDGGGFAMNVQRWAGQVGQAVPGEAALAALPTVDMMGVSAVLVDLTSDGSEQGMLVTVCTLPGQTLFVKMIGPSDRVRAHREEFVVFCGSVRAGG